MSSENIIIRDVLIPQDSTLQKQNIVITDGRIAAIGEGIHLPESGYLIDGDSRIATLGLADVHVHFRVPGNPEKETIATGSAAAAAGGFTSVCTMPNLNPAPDSPEHLEEQMRLIREESIIDVHPYAAITVGRKGREIVDVEALAPLCCGFSDDGSGVQDEGIMREAMARITEVGSILAAHCEVNELLRNGYIHDGEYARRNSHRGICSESEWRQIERDLRLADDTGCRYHVCHISTRESVELIRDAKASGVKVTCETGPHYLWFCDEDLQENGRFKMNPPLRSASDREALLEGIADGTIDIIATDHAPHTAEEKGRGLERSLMGVVGLETAFGASYTALVKSGIISLPRLLALMSENPRRIFRLGGKLAVGEAADIVIMDTFEEWIVDPSRFKTKGRSTPFEGVRLTGMPKWTILRDRIVADNTVVSR